MSATKQDIRDAWATWNPQRAAAKELQRQVEQGTITLEVGWPRLLTAADAISLDGAAVNEKALHNGTNLC